MSKIKILSIILLFAAITVSAQTFSGGAGTYSNPYLISSKADMEALANAVNSGTGYANNFFRLTQNLTGANALTTSVGTYNGGVFQGVFDGNGYEIEVNNTPGVFGNLYFATIQNLGVKGTVSASGNYQQAGGGICASASNSTIAYCYNSATVSATSSIDTEVRVGGICGFAYLTTITDCFNIGVVSSASSGMWCWSGGICGNMSIGNILNCYNTGNISAVCQTSYGAGSGGICARAEVSGTNQSSIKNCFSANSSIQAKLEGGSQNCYEAGRITGYDRNNIELGNNYALSTMTVNGSTISSSNTTDINGSGTSLANFKSQSWIQNTLKWDFGSVWQMSSSGSANQGFPVFRSGAKPVSYTITAKAGNNGSISSAGDTKVSQGGSMTYSFIPHSGFELYQVLIDNNYYYGDIITSGSYTFTDIARNHTIEVFFRPVNAPAFSGGNGTKSSPYLISSKADMVALADAVEGGTTYTDKFFRLTQNLTGANALSRAVGIPSNSNKAFQGIFDGNGYEIELSNAEGGIFGFISNAIIQNLGAKGTVTTPASRPDYPYAGGICAYADRSKIYNCRNSATVSTKSVVSDANCIGGICGYAYYSEIMYCYNTGNITSSVALSTGCNEGGIAGYSYYTQISNCFNSGQVSGSGSNFNFYCGGINGYTNSGAITNCYNSGNISAVSQSGYWTVSGGISGYADDDTEISNSFSANTSIEAKYYGGNGNGETRRIAGYESTKYSNNYALSTMTVNGSTVNSSDVTSRDGAGASLVNFKSQSWIQSSLGWNFSTVWEMSSSSSSFQGFPVLRNETKIIYFTITATATNNGSISSSGASSVALGESKTYTVTPKSGYQIYRVSIDGDYNSGAVASGSYTFTDVARDHTIEVFFRPVTAPTFSGGEGTEASPYLISSKADMEVLAGAVEGGTTYTDKFFRLTQNLTGSNAVSTSIGISTGIYSPFQGTFDGKGYEIELNNASGVFGYISRATIQNLKVKGTVFVSTVAVNAIYAGGICAYADNSTIISCSNAAAVSANADRSTFAGGICGYARETSLSDCFNTGSISSSSNSGCQSGGICGYMGYSHILNGYNTGNISAISQPNYITYSGGICGYVSGQSSIKNSFSANSSVEAKYGAGRITGYFSGELNNNYALSTMTANGSTVSSSDAASKDGAGTSLANFKSQSWIQSNLSWDFGSIWKMSASGSANQGFPVFKASYTIIASAGNGGSISPSGDISLIEGENKTFTIKSDTGYEIDNVLVDGVANASAKENSSYTFSNITANHTISVTFKLKTYTITASAGSNGNISPSGNISVAHGDNKNFTFTPNTGYVIDDVLIDGSSDASAKTSGSYTFSSVSSNHTISVIFKLSPYTITATTGAGGSISPNGNVPVAHGDSKAFTFTPDTGYEIDNVLVDGSSNSSAKTSGSYAFSNVSSNHAISVTFKLKTYTITATASDGGSISPSGNVSVSHGSDQTFTFTPHTGYLIDDVLVDGSSNVWAIASGQWTFQNVTGNHTISVGFKPECLSGAIIQVWDDVLSVVNNPANNGGYTFFKYQWYKNGAAIQGETSGNLYLANDADRATAQYTCRVTISSGQTLETCPVRLTSSVLKVYPNPTEGKVMVENLYLKAGDKIEIINSSGMLVRQFQARPLQTEIDLGNFPKGIYIIKVNNKQVKIILL
jgi:hypothetical protein